MLFRKPLYYDQVTPETGVSLARLTALEGFARAVMVGVLPLVALQAFGSKEIISSVYFASSLFTLIFTINIATLERLLQRRWLVTLGAAFLVISVLFFYSLKAPLFALGLGIRSAGASIFSVCLSLYIMDHIGKAELVRNESRRMIYNGTAWLLAPMIGVWVFDNVSPNAVYLISAGAAVIMISYFWRLRLGDDAIIRAARSRSVNPIHAVAHFVAQRRLRIAYMVVLSRACYWAALFVYGPIYVVEAGLPTWIAGILLAGASGFLFLSPMVQRLANRFGTRQAIMGYLVLIALSMVALGLIGEAQPVGLLFWVTGAIGAAGIDVLGNIPFMRTVRPRERTEMTMVFTTWRETSSLLTQALVFLTLLVAPFWVVYFLLGGLMVAAATAASFLPRRL